MIYALFTVLNILATSVTVFSVPLVFAQETPENVQEVLTRIQLNEGTEVVLDPAILEDLKPWMNNSKVSLEDVKQEVLSMRPSLAKEHLLRRLRDVVLASAPKQTELLMRYVLNRAVKIVEIMDQYQAATGVIPGFVMQQNRVMEESIDLALSYYESDLKFLKGQESQQNGGTAPQSTSSSSTSPATPLTNGLPLAEFGLRYMDQMFRINESQLNARSQYAVGYFLTALLHVDLARDQHGKAYAPAVRKLKAFLDGSPSIPPASDQDAVAILRTLRTCLEGSVKIVSEARKSLRLPVDEKLFVVPKSSGSGQTDSITNDKLNEVLRAAKSMDILVGNKYIYDYFMSYYSKFSISEFQLILLGIRYSRNSGTYDEQIAKKMIDTYLSVRCEEWSRAQLEEFMLLKPYNENPSMDAVDSNRALYYWVNHRIRSLTIEDFEWSE